MIVAEWDVTAMLLYGSELSGMMPTLFTKNPGERQEGRRQAEVDGKEAIQICQKPRAGEAVHVFKQVNIEALQNPPRTSAQAEPQPSGSGTTHNQSGAPAGPQPSGSGSQPAQKKPRLETTSDQGTGICSQSKFL
jgi:hypothetical protein